MLKVLSFRQLPGIPCKLQSPIKKKYGQAFMHLRTGQKSGNWGKIYMSNVLCALSFVNEENFPVSGLLLAQ